MEYRVGDIADALPVKVQLDDTLGRALQVMMWCGIRHLPVMRGEQLVAVLSERDILRCYADMGKLAGELQPISGLSKRPPVTIEADQDIATAARLMLEHGIGCLPVLSGGRLRGLVTRRDLLTRAYGPLEEVAPTR